MGNLAPHADLPSMRTVPCGHPKTGYCLFWWISKPMHSRWCTGAYSACSRPNPLSVFTSSAPHSCRGTPPRPRPPPPLFAHDGTERRIVRPQDPPQQAACYSGKKKDHTVKNVLLVNALLLVSLTMGSVDDNREHPVYRTGVTDRCSSDP